MSPSPAVVRAPRRSLRAAAVTATAALLLAGCSSGGNDPAPTSIETGPATSSSGAPGTSGAAADGPAGTIGPDGCVVDFDPAADYFPDKSTLTHAENFDLSYHGSYQVLTVQQPTQGGSPESYVLLRCGAPTPELTGELAGATVVTTPVRSVYSGSTSHLPNFPILDQLDTLTGVASKALISEPEVQARVADPEVAEYAAAGTVDAETVIAGRPDVVITAGTDDPAYATISAAGVPVLADAEWLENDPLGRAEWVKYFAALTGTEAEAATFFDQLTADYQRIKDSVPAGSPVPVVPGQPYQGTWYVPAGDSYGARLLADAGGTTAWADESGTGSISTDLESVLARAQADPVWLASTTWTTAAEALADEPRVAEFAAFTAGNVWNAAADVTAAGGNNYYELGVARPDLILGDLVAILHPDTAPGHDFAFYLRLS
ncbi:ABC transporter substrate-binding protein [Nakamurella leprariae]|uniref:ABC transporter substrate-binding protein n=1 Tax=Nakamurella leprariae TaxID=2803911 RepID=A0A938YFI8_9ACTN|nr:ABC transporter substrate-binding protein [Nakamurella leprariae]MBM9468606.1 ABC transporter substrate-binding protein [Nakamurella leprariae]